MSHKINSVDAYQLASKSDVILVNNALRLIILSSSAGYGLT